MTFQNMGIFFFLNKDIISHTKVFQLTNNTVCNLSSIVQEAEVSSF